MSDIFLYKLDENEDDEPLFHYPQSEKTITEIDNKTNEIISQTTTTSFSTDKDGKFYLN